MFGRVIFVKNKFYRKLNMGKTILSSNVPKRLLVHTFINTTEKINITQFVQNYSELIIYVRPAVNLRWQPPQIIPTDLLVADTSYAMYFEGGMYTTSNAYTGYRFAISYDGTNYYVNGEWLYYEGNASNTYMVIYQ